MGAIGVQEPCAGYENGKARFMLFCSPLGQGGNVISEHSNALTSSARHISPRYETVGPSVTVQRFE